MASELGWQFDNALELVHSLTPRRVAVDAKSIVLSRFNCRGTKELDGFFSKVIQGLLLHIVQQLFVCAARIELKNQLRHKWGGEGTRWFGQGEFDVTFKQQVLDQSLVAGFCSSSTTS